ncbi:hypothetical protein VC83_02544 [Pseudogymnoascus destructans]|uniref:Uncharacterized protein n=1 Tax=Pseudogymnoascus destructans TaxID=655981 RepID=A0A177AGA4_9PEZI|nr:uncharacterized protein VC83_02544 [Pseudogymnoascus destructans]OAF60850.1 hypothetical protein VC83_02544 [Pseudogymnoascus destructans]
MGLVYHGVSWQSVMFEEGKFIRLFDAGSAVCKSDALVSDSLRLALKDGIAPSQDVVFGSRSTACRPFVVPISIRKDVGVDGRPSRPQYGFKLIGSGKPAPKQ